MNRTFSIYGAMVSGQGEQAVRTYKKIIGENNTWYVAVQDNAADNVYCTPNFRKEGERSQGFAGATLQFKLEDGTVDNVQGPWHGNAGSMKLDTGIDLTNTCLTQGICAKGITGSLLAGYEYLDVLHYDEVATLGSYNRIEELAQKLANENNCTVHYAMKSSGGGHSHYKDPQ